MSEQSPWLLLVILGAVLVLSIVIVLVMLARFYRKVAPGQALIINTTRGPARVSFTGGFVWPILHRADVLDITMKTLAFDRRGSDALVCADKVRADLAIRFFIRIPKTSDDVLKVASLLGCQRASDPAALDELFASKFIQALQTVAAQLDFERLNADRERFTDEVMSVIGRDLDGYLLDEIAIDSLERSAVSSGDSNSSLDARSVHRTEQVLGQRDHD